MSVFQKYFISRAFRLGISINQTLLQSHSNSTTVLLQTLLIIVDISFWFICVYDMTTNRKGSQNQFQYACFEWFDVKVDDKNGYSENKWMTLCNVCPNHPKAHSKSDRFSGLWIMNMLNANEIAFGLINTVREEEKEQPVPSFRVHCKHRHVQRVNLSWLDVWKEQTRAWRFR